MGVTPTKTAIMGTFCNGRNDAQDFVQFATNNGDGVFAWIDSAGTLRGSLAGTFVGGATTDVQINNGGIFYGDSGFTYNPANGVIQINPPGPVFAAPVITPNNNFAGTWGYTIVARQGTVNIATSAEGRTTTGSNVSLFSSGNTNTITWTAVPGATAYDVFLSTSSVTPLGYITTVVGTTYTDAGNPAPINGNFLPPAEAGFMEISTGAHFGNMSWGAIAALTNGTNGPSIQTLGIADDSPFSSLVTETVAPPAHGTLTQSPNFTAGNFIAYQNGSTRSAVGLFATAIGTNPNTAHGIDGIVATAINNMTTATQNWAIGTTSSGVTNSTGNMLLLLGYYSSTTVSQPLSGTINVVADYYADVFNGVKSANIGVYAGFYANQMTHANAGAGALTAAFYAGDTGLGAGDWGFYSLAGKNFFGGSILVGTLAVSAATPTGVAGQVSFGTTAGFGTGAAGTAVTTTTKGGGTGPTTPQTVVNYMEIDISGTKYWVPLVQ